MIYRPLFVLPEGIRNIAFADVVNHLKSYPGWKWGTWGECIRLSCMKDEFYDMKYNGKIPTYTGVSFKNGRIDSYDWQISYPYQTGRNQALQLYKGLISTLSNISGRKPIQMEESLTRKISYLSDGSREFTISFFTQDSQWIVDFACTFL